MAQSYPQDTWHSARSTIMAGSARLRSAATSAKAGRLHTTRCATLTGHQWVGAGQENIKGPGLEQDRVGCGSTSICSACIKTPGPDTFHPAISLNQHQQKSWHRSEESHRGPCSNWGGWRLVFLNSSEGQHGPLLAQKIQWVAATPAHPACWCGIQMVVKQINIF